MKFRFTVHHGSCLTEAHAKVVADGLEVALGRRARWGRASRPGRWGRHFVVADLHVEAGHDGGGVDA